MKTPETDDVLARQEIRNLIGGLNGRFPYLRYLERQIGLKTERGQSREELVGWVQTNHQFWSTLLKFEMGRYDQMRDERKAHLRSYAFIHYEFDDLFRYCENPDEAFELNSSVPPTADEAQMYAEQFRVFVEEQRQGLRSTKLPMGLRSFFFAIYRSAIRSIPAFLRARNRTATSSSLWQTAFLDGRQPKSVIEEEARRFWKRSVATAIGFNVVMLGFMIAGLFELAGVDLVLGIIFVIIIDLLFIPIATRAVFQYYRFGLSRKYGRSAGIAAVRTWKDAQNSIQRIWTECAPSQQHVFSEMLFDMEDNHVVSRSEAARLSTRDFTVCPGSPEARDRIKRWLNKQSSAGITTLEPTGSVIPAVDNWNDVSSLTIVVFSLNERFAYGWEELMRVSEDGEKLAGSVLHKLRGAYNPEWANLVEDLSARFGSTSCEGLLERNPRFGDVSSPEIRNAIVRWANLRLQTIYNTLEGVSKTFRALEVIASQSFPDESPAELMSRAREKLQIILLHDLYPTYGENDRQKLDLDIYFKHHPEMELAWPEDMLHPSKSGAWANVLPQIRGDYLMTLDSDHSVWLEETYFIPNMLREFELDSELDALQFTLHTFNSRYSWVARCAGLAGDVWWRQELRVKALIGGGGAYGKLVYRTSSIEPKELIQPDSVGEDMLTMARLQALDARIGFVEYFHMGHGEEVTFEGIKRKYGRYPIGGLESSVSKLFIEMLRSAKPYWHRKAEALWMVSYYPLQVLIVVANVLILLGLAMGITFSFLYLPLLLISAGFGVLISEGLLAIVNLTERYGRIKGILAYLGYFFPMSIFHGSYVPFYLRQFSNGLKGYARFNVTVKRGELREGSWDETYENNAWSVRYGAAMLTLAVFGMVASPLSAIGYIAYSPFFFSALVWTIGPFVFVSRRSLWRKALDILFVMPYVVGRTFADFFDGIGRMVARSGRRLVGRAS